jgi:hypothetical protein
MASITITHLVHQRPDIESSPSDTPTEVQVLQSERVQNIDTRLLRMRLEGPRAADVPESVYSFEALGTRSELRVTGADKDLGRQLLDLHLKLKDPEARRALPLEMLECFGVAESEDSSPADASRQ